MSNITCRCCAALRRRLKYKTSTPAVAGDVRIEMGVMDVTYVAVAMPAVVATVMTVVRSVTVAMFGISARFVKAAKDMIPLKGIVDN